MTQRSSRKGKRLRGLPPDPQDERALQRIRFHASEWDQLNWYLHFSREEWEKLSPGERLSLSEEVKAIERTMVRRTEGGIGYPIRSEQEIQALQVMFREKITELADTGFVSLGPFDASISVGLGLWQEQVAGGKYLEYHFAQLLKKFPEGIQRCPKCQTIFLRPRVNAYYCSRSCQNVAAMRKIRQRKNPATQGRQARTKKERS